MKSTYLRINFGITSGGALSSASVRQSLNSYIFRLTRCSFKEHESLPSVLDLDSIRDKLPALQTFAQKKEIHFRVSLLYPMGISRHHSVVIRKKFINWNPVLT